MPMQFFFLTTFAITPAWFFILSAQNPQNYIFRRFLWKSGDVKIKTVAFFELSPRHPNQKYCSSKECQRVRKTEWQRKKMANDEDYRKNQADCQQRWRAKNINIITFQSAIRYNHIFSLQGNKANSIMCMIPLEEFLPLLFPGSRSKA